MCPLNGCHSCNRRESSIIILYRVSYDIISAILSKAVQTGFDTDHSYVGQQYGKQIA